MKVRFFPVFCQVVQLFPSFSRELAAASYAYVFKIHSILIEGVYSMIVYEYRTHWWCAALNWCSNSCVLMQWPVKIWLGQGRWSLDLSTHQVKPNQSFRNRTEAAVWTTPQAYISQLARDQTGNSVLENFYHPIETNTGGHELGLYPSSRALVSTEYTPAYK